MVGRSCAVWVLQRCINTPISLGCTQTLPDGGNTLPAKVRVLTCVNVLLSLYISQLIGSCWRWKICKTCHKSDVMKDVSAVDPTLVRCDVTCEPLTCSDVVVSLYPELNLVSMRPWTFTGRYWEMVVSLYWPQHQSVLLLNTVSLWTSGQSAAVRMIQSVVVSLSVIKSSS